MRSPPRSGISRKAGDFSFLDETEIVGIEPLRNELISRLLEGNPKRTVISVVGMGGLGKTTFAKKVYDNQRVVGHFDCHAWVTVSQSFKMEELLRNMAKKFYQGRKEAVPEDEILDLQHVLDPPPCLSRLELYGRLDKLPDWISKLKSLVKLGLWKSRLSHDPMEVLGAQLPNLLELELLQTHAVEQLCFEAIGFQKLKVLRICDLIELKKVKIENGALPQVEELEIGPSPQLEEVPHGIYYLRKLKTLAFRDMQEEFELSMLPYRGRNYDIVEHIPNVFFYQRLSGQHYAVQSLRQLAETIPRVYC
ncbi:hypothetical protein AAG906_028070 [Vitis piasezkii]